MDGASHSTLVSLALWRMDVGVDRKRRHRSLMRRLKCLLRLTARLFRFTHHQRAAIDPWRVADSEAAVTSSPADQTEVWTYCLDGLVTSLVLFYDPKSELNWVLLKIYDCVLWFSIQTHWRPSTSHHTSQTLKVCLISGLRNTLLRFTDTLLKQ